ncbi:hypothetical protein [Microbacterium sp. GXF0217]
MRTARTTLVGVLLGLLVAACTITPASASAITPVADAPAEQLMPVNDEPWSGPAYPVLCRHTSGQVACTPLAAADVKPQQCFIEVFLDGAEVTVCTTYEGHVPALQAAGGKNLKVEYGCSVGDVVCVTFENAGRGMAIGATAVMMLVASTMEFDTSTLLWTAALTEWSFWQWAVLVIVFCAMVWSIAAAVVSGQREELVAAVIRAFIAIPAVPLTLWTIGHLLNAIDDMTWYILNRDGPITMMQTLQKVMWAGGHANYFFAFLIHGLLLLSMFLLMLVFTFRNIALAALIAVGPVAWMLFPIRTVGPQWVARYVSAVVALLLAGPLTIGFITLIINGLATVDTIWNPEAWPLLIGLVLAAFAPFAVFGLFSFVGGVAADSIGSRVGGGGARIATNAARSASRMPSRLASLPAGIPGSGHRTRAGAGGPAASGRRPAGATAPAGKPTPSGASAPTGSVPKSHTAAATPPSARAERNPS